MSLTLNDAAGMAGAACPPKKGGKRKTKTVTIPKPRKK